MRALRLAMRSTAQQRGLARHWRRVERRDSHSCSEIGRVKGSKGIVSEKIVTEGSDDSVSILHALRICIVGDQRARKGNGSFIAGVGAEIPAVDAAGDLKGKLAVRAIECHRATDQV